MDQANEIIQSLYDKFIQNPLAFTAFIILAVGVYVIYSQVDKLVDYIPTPAYENEQFGVSLNRDKQINDALEDAREFYGADIILIAQFHNGQYDLTRLPFTKVSITYYQGNLNPEEQDNLYSARPLSTMNKMMLRMWTDKENPKCIASRVENLNDILYQQRLQGMGINFVTLCPLTNIRNYPIGYLSAGYRTEETDPESVDIILDYQKTLAARISGYLEEGSIREKRD